MIAIDEILAFDCPVFIVGAAPIEISPALEALPESWPLIGGELSFNGGMPLEIAFLGQKSRFNKSKIDCENYSTSQLFNSLEGEQKEEIS